MALSHPDGTKVVITAGDHKGKRGTISTVGRIKVVLAEEKGGNTIQLMGITDQNVRKL